MYYVPPHKQSAPVNLQIDVFMLKQLLTYLRMDFKYKVRNPASFVRQANSAGFFMIKKNYSNVGQFKKK